MGTRNDTHVDATVAALAKARGHEQRKPLRESLRARGPAVAPRLVEHLQHPDCFLRWEVVSLLGEFAHPETARQVLEFALTEDELHARWRSFWAVCRFDPDVTIPVLLEALKRPRSVRAWRAALILSMLRRQEAVPVLCRGLTSDEEWVRWEAVSAIKALAPAGMAPQIAALLHTEQPRAVRQEATLALGNLPDADVVPLLAGALEDDDAQVRWRAAMALCRHGNASALKRLRGRLRRETEDQVIREIARAITKLEQAHGKTQIQAAERTRPVHRAHHSG